MTITEMLHDISIAVDEDDAPSFLGAARRENTKNTGDVVVRPAQIQVLFEYENGGLKRSRTGGNYWANRSGGVVK